MIFSIDLVLYETLQFTCTNFDGCHTEEDNFFNLLQKEGGTHLTPPTPYPPKKKQKKRGGVHPWRNYVRQNCNLGFLCILVGASCLEVTFFWECCGTSWILLKCGVKFV